MQAVSQPDLTIRKFSCAEAYYVRQSGLHLQGSAAAIQPARQGRRFPRALAEVLRLVVPLQAGTVLPSAMLKCLAAFQRQNQLDLALQEPGRIERTRPWMIAAIIS